MRGGKSILAVLLATIVAQFVPPIRDWFVHKFLDNITNSPNGAYGFAARVLSVIAPFQQFLLGVSVGLLIAVTIGYWAQIEAKSRYWASWVKGFLWLAWQCRPGIRRISHGFIWLYANDNIRDAETIFPAHTDTVRIEWWPRDKVHVTMPLPHLISVRRVDPSVRENINVSYELFGSIVFWKTIRNWRESGFIRSRLNFKDMMREREKAGADHLPEFEP